MHEGGCITYQRGFGSDRWGTPRQRPSGTAGNLTAAIWRTRRWIPNGSRGAGYPKHQAPG